LTTTAASCTYHCDPLLTSNARFISVHVFFPPGVSGVVTVSGCTFLHPVLFTVLFARKLDRPSAPELTWLFSTPLRTFFYPFFSCPPPFHPPSRVSGAVCCWSLDRWAQLPHLLFYHFPRTARSRFLWSLPYFWFRFSYMRLLVHETHVVDVQVPDSAGVFPFPCQIPRRACSPRRPDLPVNLSLVLLRCPFSRIHSILPSAERFHRQQPDRLSFPSDDASSRLLS